MKTTDQPRPVGRSCCSAAFALLTLCLALMFVAQDGQAQGLKGAEGYTNSASYTTNFIAFTEPGRVNMISVQNSSGADAWLHIYDATSIQPDGTAATFTPIKIPTSSPTGGWDFNLYNLPMRNGLVLASSTTDRALTNTTGGFKFTVIYTK